MSVIVVGVDGGGSATRVLVTDELGRELASSTGPASAVRPGMASESADIIAATVNAALASAGMSHVRPRAICAGVAGTGREPDRDALARELIDRDVADETDVQTDAAIALADAFGDGGGVVLVAGTGSMAFGRGPTGRSMRAGGWGPAIGDEGSGAWIGRRALGIAAASVDGREPETALVGALLTACEVADASGFIGWAAHATPADYSRLVSAVAETAAQGDLRANSLITLAVEDLVLHVRALARELYGDERAAVPVALAGGLMKPGSLVRKRTEHRLKSAVPGGIVHAGEVIPVRGAARAALRLVGVAAGSA